jgi:hypothetical protein
MTTMMMNKGQGASLVIGFPLSTRAKLMGGNVIQFYIFSSFFLPWKSGNGKGLRTLIVAFFTYLFFIYY